jgi:hypothetical protein
MTIEINVNPYSDPDDGQKAISKALYQLRKKLDSDKTIETYKEKRYHTPRSEKKRLAKNKAIFIQKKKNEEWD